MMTMAKGLTSAYVPMGAVGMRRSIADHFGDKVFPGGLTYNSHPIACAAALATLQAYEEDDMIGNARRLGPVMSQLQEDLASRHAIVGAHRSIGLFGMIELVRDRRTKEPLAPFGQNFSRDAAADDAAAGGGALHVRPLAHLLHEPAAVRDRGAAASRASG